MRAQAWTSWLPSLPTCKSCTVDVTLGCSARHSSEDEHLVSFVVKKTGTIRRMYGTPADSDIHLYRTDPFDSIYRMVFQFTMRTIACNDIADDPKTLAKCLQYFETIDGTATPWSIMYPWMPLWSKVQRTAAGAKLYMVFKSVVDGRKKSGIRGDDPLQYLIDQGDDITSIVTFVVGALFAGQLNSGINAAYVLMYLANNSYWLPRVREEVISVADRHCPDDSIALKERLMRVPIEAWENEFPLVDMCLKDSIRLQMSGTAFRKNVTDHEIPINKSGMEVVPAGAYVAWHVGDIHYNPEIYANPDEWDPARYMPDRAEDKKEQYGFMGWGLVSTPLSPSHRC